jgi:hypothetical protein
MAVYDCRERTSASAVGRHTCTDARETGSPEYFEVLGIKPLMSLLFRDEANRWGNNFVAIITTTSRETE